MARKIPRDSTPSAWAANPFVEATPDYSRIKSGFLNTSLFLPITKNRRVCFERHKIFADWKYEELFASSQFIEDLAKPDAELSNSIILTASGNHWHFNIDGLANLSEAVISQCNCLSIDTSVSKDQIDFLITYTQLLGYQNIDISILSSSNYSLRNCYIPVNNPFATKVAAFRANLDRMEGIRRHPDAGERLYVSRKGAETRQLVNEDELFSMLKSEFGFREILNENYSIIEQVSIYRDAYIVMGPHGAGLTDILFSKNPSLLVEMFNSVQQPFYQALAQALGIRYLGIPGTSALPDNDPYRADNAPFRVDVAGIREALGKLLG